MAQYQNSTATLSASTDVVLVGVDATAEIAAGDEMLRVGEGIPYYVSATPTYAAGDTTVVLTAPYAGTPGAGVSVTFQRDFTTDGIPILYSGDVEPAGVMGRLAGVVQSIISAIVAGTKALTSVNITGGSITGITDLAVADGGTGASTATAARTNLGVEIGVDVAAYVKNNYAGTTAPTVNDDSSSGYSAGSVWADTTASPNEVYRCTDASVGAAVWLNTSLELGDLGGAALLETAEVSRRVATTATATATQYAKLRTYSFPAGNNVAAKSTLLLTPIGDSAHYQPILIEVIAKQGTSGLDTTNAQINVIRNSEEAVLYNDFDLVTATATNGTDIMLWMRSVVAARYAMQVVAEEFDTGVSVANHDNATWTATNPVTGAAASITSDFLPIGVVEAGSNSNGNYIRYADGTLYMWHTKNTSASADVTWTFPYTSLTKCERHITLTTGLSSISSAVFRNDAALTSSDIAGYTASGREALTCNVSARGTWK